MPEEVAKRNYFFDTVRSVFRLYGYRPIETPAMENLSTLTGKYGQEGDRLLFRILNSGDFLAPLTPQERAEASASHLAARIADKGLRYDLTVPFARFVVQHREHITLPFKRYQIQPVWRADRPQKGRFREFYQCDIDVVGSPSLSNEVELIEITGDIFRRLRIPVTIRINHRKLLAGIAQAIGQEDKINDITTALDKMDKIGREGVNEELADRGLSRQAIDRLQPIMQMQGTAIEKLDQMRRFLDTSPAGQEGVGQLQYILERCQEARLSTQPDIDLTLARGLDYYTGTIFEVSAQQVNIGSICGGGRYDNLTGIFGQEGLSGVGISFGAERICEVLETLALYPAINADQTRLLFAHSDVKAQHYCLPWAQQLRKEGISTEIYPEEAKLKKQLAYANAQHIPFVAIAAEEEMEQNKVTLKDMHTGEQQPVTLDELRGRIV